MKGHILEEEEYPVFILEPHDEKAHRYLGEPREIPDDLYQRYVAAEKAWREVQKEIDALSTEWSK